MWILFKQKRKNKRVFDIVFQFEIFQKLKNAIFYEEKIKSLTKSLPHPKQQNRQRRPRRRVCVGLYHCRSFMYSVKKIHSSPDS